MRGLGLGPRFGRGRGIGASTDFIFTVETTAPDETFTTPCQNVGVFNAVMDHGDGSISSITAYDDADLAHTYADAGIHTIRVSGSFPNIYFNNGGDKDKVRSVIQLGKVGWETLDKSFRGCAGMTSFIAGVCDTSAVVVMQSMLFSCSALTLVDLSGLDTENVENMVNLVRACPLLETINISGINTAKCATMLGAFYGDSLLNIDLSGLAFDAVQDLTGFIFDCDAMSSANLDLLLASIYAQRASITWETPALDISSLTNDPTGIYQDAIPPTTGLEYVYKLVNDPAKEGFNKWTITY